MSKSVRGSRTDKIRTNISRDIETAQSGITLTNLDKYYTVCYDRLTTIFHYFQSGVCLVSEYTNCIEKGKAALAQLSEDMKLLYEDGILFRKLEGFYLDIPQAELKITQMKSVFLDSFMRLNNGGRSSKSLSIPTADKRRLGGNIINLEEELKNLCSQGYCTVVLAGSEKTLPIINKDLNDAGISAGDPH